MKKIKALLLSTTFLMALPLWAQSLRPDFVCSGKTSEGQAYEVTINIFDLMKEVRLKYRSMICDFPVAASDYTEQAGAAVMVLNCEPSETCPVRKVTFLEKAFLKVHLHKSSPEAYIL